VREAVFSLVESRIGGSWDGLVVADLYAGSGAFALESLSRGAARAVAVDSAPAAARAAQANGVALGLGAGLTVLRRKVERALANSELSRLGPFGLVFLDPPYGLSGAAVAAVLDLLACGGTASGGLPAPEATRPESAVAPPAGRRPGGLLTEGALILLERSTRGGGPRWPAGWEALGERIYGETAIHLARA
jgi:16S rRNA (guanine966-N2)-methyltransferase